ncbi:MAG: 4Fe-4S binding protein [Endomicrobium sp.]|nr:4Fe-4S binding protein [Endomicrobium sp.]
MNKNDDKKYIYTATTLPIGDIVEAGTASKFYTGDWRVKKPIWNSKKCINCLTCWIYCPDSSIKLTISDIKQNIINGIDYKYCKGCGICAKECKLNAIIMEEEIK